MINVPVLLKSQDLLPIMKSSLAVNPDFFSIIAKNNLSILMGVTHFMKKRPVIFIPFAVLVSALLLGGLFLGIVWLQFSSPTILGSTAIGEDDVTRSVNWLTDYASQLNNWKVPPSRRILDVTVTQTEDLGNGCVQLDFSFTTLITHARFDDNFSQCVNTQDGHSFTGSLVLRWEDETIVEVMRPAAWQIAYSPEIQAEREQPQTQHYTAETYNGKPYLVENEVLYVTYNNGASYVEVPDGYDLVCRRSGGSNQEVLTCNQYIINSELTAFLIYNEDHFLAYLYYSKDEGQTWSRQEIGSGYQANSFLSLTDTGVYATFAVDRAAGSDYYGTYFSSDLIHWSSIPLSSSTRNFSCVFWTAADVGYYSGGTVESVSGETSICHYVTFDKGESYQVINYTPVWSFVEQAGGVDPFDTLDEMYESDGVCYMVLGQGDDGDLTIDGEQIKLRYRSTDGINFEFDAQISDSNEAVG